MPRYYDDNIDRDALLAQMDGGRTARGVSRQAAQPATVVDAPPAEAPQSFAPTEPTKPTYEGWGQYHVAGLDPEKVKSGHDSPKYQIARIQSHFDPTKGVTQEMIDALNALQYGGQQMAQFRYDPKATSNDWLYADNGVDKFQGVKGADLIRDFGPGGANEWQGWGGDYGTPNAGKPQGRSQGAAMSGGPSSFQGIESLMPTDTNFYNSLQQKLQEILGGQGAFDRDALLQMLGAK